MEVVLFLQVYLIPRR